MIVLHKDQIPAYLGMDTRLDAGLQLIADGCMDRTELGRVDVSDCLYHNTQRYETKPFADTRYESHEQWIDIQYLRAGQEQMDILLCREGLRETERKPEADVMFYEPDGEIYPNRLNLAPGMLAIFYPEDIHRPCICAGQPETVEKVVLKVRV